jgi:exonuclease SbcD
MFPDRVIESYTEAVNAVIDSAGIDRTRRNVLLSHQFYVAAGAVPIRSESEISPVGGLDAVDAGAVARFDYAALGHLHGCQSAGPRSRYAGSPVKYSFSERRQNKGVLLITLGAKGEVDITALPLTPLRDMREIKGPIEELTRGDIAALGDREDYIRVILTDEEEIIDPMGKLRSVYPNIMALDFENSRTRARISEPMREAGESESLSPYDLFSEFFLEASGAVMTGAQAGIVRRLLEGVGDE